jgi:hypothetical protein
MAVTGWGATIALAVVVVSALAASEAPSGAVRYGGCAALRTAHPRGVARPGAHDVVIKGTPATGFAVDAETYAANRRLDRDGDGVLCERSSAGS